MQKITAVATEEARLDLLAAQASGASRSQAASTSQRAIPRPVQKRQRFSYSSSKGSSHRA